MLTHARALLTGSDEGATAYVEADLREPEKILNDATLTATLDLGQPVGLILVAVLHFVPGAGAVQPILGTLLDALAPGSFVVATHVTQDFIDQATRDRYWQMYHAGKADIWPRSQAEFATSLAGLELVEPGIVPVHEWRPQPGSVARRAEEVGILGAVARKS